MSKPTGHHYKPPTLDGKPLPAKSPPAQLASVQWEYRVAYWPLVPSDPDDPSKEYRALVAGLNELGGWGWECFSTIGGTTGVRCFLKRPKPSVWDSPPYELSDEAKESLRTAARNIQRDMQPRPDERPL